MPRKRPPAPPKLFNRPVRFGTPTKIEREFVARFVGDQPSDLTPAQMDALSDMLRRTPASIKKMVEQERLRFTQQVAGYIDTHWEATQGALEEGDYDTATKAAQWALTNMSAEGARVIDRPETGPVGSKIQIGIQVGGVDQPVQTIALPALTTEPDDPA